MGNHWKKVSSEVFHQNPWWAYRKDITEGPGGEKGEYYYGETPGSGCAMVIPILKDGRMLVVRQYRYLRDRYSVEFPCGGLNPGEAPEDAARREMLEETGCTVEELINIGNFDGMNGLFKDTLHLFVSAEVEHVHEAAPEKTEEIELLFRRPDEFEEMIDRGEIWDGQTLAAWAMARKRVLGRQL